MEEREEFRARSLEDLGILRQEGYLRSVKQAQTMKQYYDETKAAERDMHAFAINNWVKMKHHGKTKFEFNWRGPYYITKLGPAGTYYLMDARGRHLDSAIA